MGKRKRMVTIDDTRVTELEEHLKAVADRPYWQADPCPVWCWGHHRDSDHPDDRRHYASWEADLPLSLEEPHVVWTKREGEDVEVVDPPALQIHVAQGLRETAPRVSLGTFIVDHAALEIDMTLAEARALANELNQAVLVAEGKA